MEKMKNKATKEGRKGTHKSWANNRNVKMGYLSRKPDSQWEERGRPHAKKEEIGKGGKEGRKYNPQTP